VANRVLHAMRAATALILAAAVFCVPLGYAYLAPVTATSLEPLSLIPDVTEIAWPRSPGDAAIGVDYPAWLSSCLTLEPLDFDDSFWEPDTGAESTMHRREGDWIFGLKGTIRLEGPSRAVFRTEHGSELWLTRHIGPKFRVPCWFVGSPFP